MDSSCYIKLRAFLHGLRLAKCSVPLVLQVELQMSAVFNKREGMGLVRKTELVSPTKWWADICFLQLHCRGTYLHFSPNIYTDGDKKGLGYHSTNTYFPTFYGGNQWRLAFRILFKIEQRKEELTRALHIFIPFNSSDAISDTSVSFLGLSLTGIAHFFCYAASDFLFHKIGASSLCILFMGLSKEIKGLLEKSRHS